LGNGKEQYRQIDVPRGAKGVEIVSEGAGGGSFGLRKRGPKEKPSRRVDDGNGGEKGPDDNNKRGIGMTNGPAAVLWIVTGT